MSEETQKEVQAETVKPNEFDKSSTPAVEKPASATPTSEQQIDLDNIKPVEAMSIDLMKHDKTETAIAKASVIQVPTKYAEIGTQWVLKVESEVLETFERTDDDGNPDNIDFSASELYNLIQGDDGKLKGFPTGDGANLMKFAKDIGIKEPEKAESLKSLIAMFVGKKVLVKAYEKDHQGNLRTYLKFRY